MRVVSTASSEEVEPGVPSSLSSVSESGASSATDAASLHEASLQRPALDVQAASAVGATQRPPPEIPGPATPNPAMVLHFDAPETTEVSRSYCTRPPAQGRSVRWAGAARRGNARVPRATCYGVLRARTCMRSCAHAHAHAHTDGDESNRRTHGPWPMACSMSDGL